MVDRAVNPRAPDSPRGAVLRLSTTDRCNLRCCYCMPAEGVSTQPRNQLLSLEELADVAAWICAETGVERIKLTGGEPFVRSGVDGLIRRLVDIPGVEEISATTNGTMLEDLAPDMADAGLGRVNVSIDTLDPERYARLTRGGRVEDVIKGIKSAIGVGLEPVKLNAVLLASGWRTDVPQLLDFAWDMGLEIRFIELMRTGTEAGWAADEFIPAVDVQTWIKSSMEGDAGSPSLTPSRGSRLMWRGRWMSVGWIMPQSEPFCDGCKRLRLDPQGRLRRCLMDPEYFPVARLLATVPETEVRHSLNRYLADKVAAPHMHSPLPMVPVGG